MPTVRHGWGAVRCLVALTVLALARPALAEPKHHGPALVEAGQRAVIASDRQQRTVELLGDVGFERPRPSGWQWDSIAIAADHVTFTVRQTQAAPSAQPASGQIVLRHRDAAGPRDRVGREFALAWLPPDPPPSLRAEFEAATASILARDRGGYFQLVGEPSPWPVLRGVAGLLGLWGLALLAWLAKTASWHVVRVRFKPTHLLPAILQSCLYGYWSLHVAEVAVQLPRIGLQVLVAYVLDFLVGLTVRRRWDATFGPVPIVLSANLFVWFPPQSFHLSLLVVAVAIASKWLLLRDGRHIFNPSALGIAVVALLSLAWPQAARFQDIAHMFSEPPRMLWLVAGLAVVAQLRVPIVPITLTAALTLLALKAVGAWHTVYPFWPAVLLGLALLATDPATIPQQAAGRWLYGLGLGLGVWAASAALTWAGYSDFYGKVLPIPLLNLLAPRLDRWGAALVTRWREAKWRRPWGDQIARLPDWLEPRYNRWHLGAWLLLAAVVLA